VEFATLGLNIANNACFLLTSVGVQHDMLLILRDAASRSPSALADVLVTRSTLR